MWHSSLTLRQLVLIFCRVPLGASSTVEYDRIERTVCGALGLHGKEDFADRVPAGSCEALLPLPIQAGLDNSSRKR